MSVQLVPLSEVWMWYALAYAFSQLSLTRSRTWAAPRSIRSHWVPAPATLAHRLLVLPSTALSAVSDELSTDEASAGRPRESRTSSAASAAIETTSGTQSTTATPKPRAVVRTRLALTSSR